MALLIYVCFCNIYCTHDAHDIFESFAGYIAPTPCLPIPVPPCVSFRYADHRTISPFTCHPTCRLKFSSMLKPSPSYYDGACAYHWVDTSLSVRPVLPPAVLCQDFESGADMPKPVLRIIHDVDPTEILRFKKNSPSM